MRTKKTNLIGRSPCHLESAPLAADLMPKLGVDKRGAEEREIEQQLRDRSTGPFIHRGLEWHFVEKIDLDFQPGHFHLVKTQRHMGYYDGYPRHLHTDVRINGETFHVDFYGIAYYGPASGVHQLSVSKDKLLVDRCRWGFCYAAFRLNVPLRIYAGGELILFQQPFYDGVIGGMYVSRWTASGPPAKKPDRNFKPGPNMPGSWSWNLPSQ